MNLDLRQAIMRNVHGKSVEELREIIQDAVGQEEKVLPGLGVLFEIIWQHSPTEEQNEMIATLHQHV
ncbi:MAG: small acid-soluble spore protein SspI [Bacillus thermozeamaize]|uniref:Small, acid-soluble spore protein I n=1 Tax=Bacillus thermozeamaize TaxID=230954 RepID=A0A1Y3PTV4_9BACI|nr:MAG: small acid-soluble spore protein SspI [Bacillus thermozeamaize]